MINKPPSFLLSVQPWIPGIHVDNQQRSGSLKQTFAEAGRIRSIAGELPTMSFAIVRLLLAILHRAVDGPADERAWRTLWRSPLPLTDIDSYLDEFQDRFDLRHPVTPFYQVADLRTAKDDPVGLERLVADVPNGTPYLTSRSGFALHRMAPAEAARWLVHCQAYDTSGIKSGAALDPRVKGGKGYPIGTGWAGALGGVLLEGANLRETLLLNLVPENLPGLRRGEGDLPVWEREPQGAAEESVQDRGPHGPLTLYTWQSRRVRLFGDDQAITGALIANGDRLEAVDQQHREPMSGWRRSRNQETKLKRAPVYTPARHDPARALWRGLGSLLPAAPSAAGTTGAATVVPVIAEWLAKARLDELIPADTRVSVRAVGVAYGTQQSVVDQIVDDRLTMPVQAFQPDGDLRTLVIDSAADAEAAVVALRNLAANLIRAAGGRSDTPGAAADRAAETAFAALDQAFRSWLAGLGPETDPAGARIAWQQRADLLVREAGDDLVRRCGPAAWAGREVGSDDKRRFICAPLADVWFRKRLAAALPLAAVPDPVDHEVTT